MASAWEALRVGRQLCGDPSNADEQRDLNQIRFPVTKCQEMRIGQVVQNDRNKRSDQATTPSEPDRAENNWQILKCCTGAESVSRSN